MVSLKEVFINFFKSHGLDVAGEKIVVADSTGVDSSVLLDLAINHLPSEVIICHVNHKKRRESDQEEEYITRYAKENNIKCYVHHLEKDQIKSNFQEEARKIRYDFFKSVMRKEGAKYLLLAHHLNDDIETMLMRLNRGSSLKGYSGIDDIVKIDEGYILRPLLTVLKKDIYEYAENKNITYFEDASNKELDYSRNVVRHKDAEEIFSAISSAANDFCEMKKNINEAVCIINKYRDEVIANTFLKIEDGYKFRISTFFELNQYIQKEILFEITKAKRLSNKEIEEIFKILRSTKANIDTMISGINVIKSYDYAYILLKKFEREDVSLVINEAKEEAITLDIDWIIKVSLIKEPKYLNVISNCHFLCYNSKWLPVLIRRPRDDDKIILDYGTKKVTKLFVDRKVDQIERKKALVVEKDDSLLMVVGYEKSKQALKECTKLENCDMLVEFIRR